MKIKLFKLSLIILSSFFFCAVANAQKVDVTVNSVSRTSTWYLPGGLVLVVDRESRRMYASNISGQSADWSIDDAMLYSVPNSNERARLLARLDALHTNPNYSGHFVFPDPNGGQVPNNPCENSYGGGPEQECMLGLSSIESRMRATSTGDNSLPGPVDLPGVEALRPEVFYVDSFSSGSMWVAFWAMPGNYSNPSMSEIDQAIYAYDHARWKAKRTASCNGLFRSSGVAAAGIVGVASACPGSLPTMGVTAYACIASVVIAADGLYSTAEQAGVCSSGYPGVGNWQ